MLQRTTTILISREPEPNYWSLFLSLLDKEVFAVQGG